MRIQFESEADDSEAEDDFNTANLDDAEGQHAAPSDDEDSDEDLSAAAQDEDDEDSDENEDDGEERVLPEAAADKLAERKKERERAAAEREKERARAAAAAAKEIEAAKKEAGAAADQLAELARLAKANPLRALERLLGRSPSKEELESLSQELYHAAKADDPAHAAARSGMAKQRQLQAELEETRAKAARESEELRNQLAKLDARQRVDSYFSEALDSVTDEHTLVKDLLTAGGKRGVKQALERHAFGFGDDLPDDPAALVASLETSIRDRLLDAQRTIERLKKAGVQLDAPAAGKTKASGKKKPLTPTTVGVKKDSREDTALSESAHRALVRRRFIKEERERARSEE